MDPSAPRQKLRDNALSCESLDVAIEALNVAKKASSITPAKVVFSSVNGVLAMIRVSFLPVCVD